MDSITRRGLLAGSVLTFYAVALRQAWGQAVTDPVDIGSFARSFSDDRNRLSRVLIDIEFVHSWRVEIAPLGYENSGDWPALAAQNRRTIWERVSSEPAALSAASDFAAQYQSRLMASYEERRAGFEAFLQQLAIAPDGPAGQRLTESLRDFALLNVLILQDRVEDEAAARSFFWPFC